MTTRPSRRPSIMFNTTKVLEDMYSHGWNSGATAKAAGVSEATMSRFLSGANHSPKTASKIAAALGKSPRDYMIVRGEKVATR